MPTHLPTLSYQPKLEKEVTISLSQLRQQLVHLGYHEIITYSFVDPKLQTLFHPNEEVCQLSNPISSDMAVMRTSLWPSLLNALRYNQNRQQNRVRLFETGKVYRFQPDLQQVNKLGGVISELAVPEQWAIAKRKLDFYDLKGELEHLFMSSCGIDHIRFVAAVHESLHPGQSAKIEFNQQTLGWIGALHPRIQKELDLIGPIFIFELDLEPLKTSLQPIFKPFSKFPANRRDIAVVVDQALSVDEILHEIKNHASKNLIHINVFDVYEGKQLGENKKSIAIALLLQDMTQTLQDEDIQKEIEHIILMIKSKFNAELRYNNGRVSK